MLLKEADTMTKEAVEYVEEMLKLGYDLKDIRTELEKKGWKKKHINAIIRKALASKKHTQSFSKYEQFIVFFGIVLLIIAAAWISGSANTDFGTVLISFLPTLLTLLTIYYILKHHGTRYLLFMYVVPLCWAGILYLAVMNDAGALHLFELSNILMLNILMSYCFIVLLYILHTKVNPSK